MTNYDFLKFTFEFDMFSVVATLVEKKEQRKSIKKSIEKLETLKKALMQKYFG